MFHRRSHATGLPPNEAERRIQKMIAFILHDADDKAAEIRAQAEQDATRIYHEHLAAVRQQLEREYGDKRRQADAAYRKRQSRQLVAAELQVQRMRWEKVRLVQRTVRERVASLCSAEQPGVAYAELLVYLLAEALLRVADEDSVQVRYRKEDTPLMAVVSEEGVKLAVGVLRREAGVETSWQVELAGDEWLPSGQPVATDDTTAQAGFQGEQEVAQRSTNAECLGGLLVLADHGRIRVNNTLDQRLTRTVHALLPVVRAILWGDDHGCVHRMVEQRRGKGRAGRRKRVVRWERHEAHIVAVEEDDEHKSVDDHGSTEEADAKDGRATEDVKEHKDNRAGGKEEKEKEGEQRRWWREHEPELKVTLPAWSTSDRNTREEQLTDPKDAAATQQQKHEHKQQQQLAGASELPPSS